MLAKESGTELKIEDLLSPQFWQSLAPHLHIAQTDYHIESTPTISDEQGEYLR
jgi:hypothetical protein